LSDLKPIEFVLKIGMTHDFMIRHRSINILLGFFWKARLNREKIFYFIVVGRFSHISPSPVVCSERQEPIVETLVEFFQVVGGCIGGLLDVIAFVFFGIW